MVIKSPIYIKIIFSFQYR